MKLNGYISITATIALVPSIAHAQNFQAFLYNTGQFLNATVIPFLLGIAFFLFIFFSIRYFVFESASEDGRDKARNQMLYSVLAFVLILLFWGTVNLITSSLGFVMPITSGDYGPGGLRSDYTIRDE